MISVNNIVSTCLIMSMVFIVIMAVVAIFKGG